MGFELTGKVVVVSGAGSGIGRATAIACAREGARLALCDLDRDGLHETVEATRDLGIAVASAELDVSDQGAVDGFAGETERELGPADLLVNNAGIGVLGAFEDTELEDWRRLLDVNLMGVVHGCRSFLPAMKRRGGGGHVVNVASQAAFQASPALAAYSASKFAVLGFSEALRAELAPAEIGVTAVCPGVVNTPITRSSTIRGADPNRRRDRVVRLYERRNYGPEKVAAGILRAVRRNRAVAPIAPEAHLALWLSRLAPPISRWTAARLARASE